MLAIAVSAYPFAVAIAEDWAELTCEDTVRFIASEVIFSSALDTLVASPDTSVSEAFASIEFCKMVSSES